jgi:uncharacterized protein
MVEDIRQRLVQCVGFEWDAGNVPKLWARHQVTIGECEQVFFNTPLVVAADPRHSQAEPRWSAWGHTDQGRLLAVVFTLRGDRIRPFSARDMSRKEREHYGEAEADS